MLQVSKKGSGKAVYATLGMWREVDGSIHVTSDDVPGFHTYIKKGTSQFRHFDRLMKQVER